MASLLSYSKRYGVVNNVDRHVCQFPNLGLEHVRGEVPIEDVSRSNGFEELSVFERGRGDDRRKSGEFGELNDCL